MGLETRALLARLKRQEEKLGDVGAAKLELEAKTLLATCGPPFLDKSHTTGLALGYVQSGKTMSFTTLAALAKDNGYQVVIVITGSGKTLLAQSTERLKRDLGIDDGSGGWFHYPAPELTNQDLLSALEEWNDPSVLPAERRAVLITVMKDHTHLKKLRLKLAGESVRRAKALFIDDEGDQASLNTKVRKSLKSTTYKEIDQLKSAFDNHVYMQYTATPQSLLLDNIRDVLSPSVCELLMPGEDYTGGKTYFVERPELVREIPADEIDCDEGVVEAPPESLKAAFRTFVVGVAAGLHDKSVSFGKPRSMLVHPSHPTEPHQRYCHWINEMREAWKGLLSKPAGDLDREDLERELSIAHADLATTVPNLRPMAVLLDYIRRALRISSVILMNAKKDGSTPKVNWGNGAAFVLIGGVALDRGFTVKGLTVTYMPRGLGGKEQGNADSVQQRARFFGYKKSYLGYCRVFLERGVRLALRDYVADEEDLRSRLAEHIATGRPMQEWPRLFQLTRSLRPTRPEIHDVDYVRTDTGDGWFWPRGPHLSEDAIVHNRRLFERLEKSLQFGPVDGHRAKTEDARHQVARNVPLAMLLDTLISRYMLDHPPDSSAFAAFQARLTQIVAESSIRTASVYLMAGGNARGRRITNKNLLRELFEGRRASGADVYAGDRSIHAADQPTIQLHHLTIRSMNGKKTLLDNVPALTLWLPSGVDGSFVVQPQGG